MKMKELTSTDLAYPAGSSWRRRRVVVLGVPMNIVVLLGSKWQTQSKN